MSGRRGGDVTGQGGASPFKHNSGEGRYGGRIGAVPARLEGRVGKGKGSWARGPRSRLAPRWSWRWRRPHPSIVPLSPPPCPVPLESAGAEQERQPFRERNHPFGRGSVRRVRAGPHPQRPDPPVRGPSQPETILLSRSETGKGLGSTGGRPLSVVGQTRKPFVSPDGKQGLLRQPASPWTTRGRENPEYDSGWWIGWATMPSAPPALGPGVNTTAYENYPTVTADGTLFFSPPDPGCRDRSVPGGSRRGRIPRGHAAGGTQLLGG